MTMTASTRGSHDLIEWLDGAEADVTRVGGKAASLMRLARLGFRIPPGFCLTTVAFAWGGVLGASLAGAVLGATVTGAGISLGFGLLALVGLAIVAVSFGLPDGSRRTADAVA